MSLAPKFGQYSINVLRYLKITVISIFDHPESVQFNHMCHRAFIKCRFLIVASLYH